MIVCIRSFYAVKLRAIDALVVVAEVGLLVQFDVDHIRTHHGWIFRHKTGPGRELLRPVHT